MSEMGKEKGCEHFPSYIVCMKGKIYTDGGKFATCGKCEAEGIEHCCYGTADTLMQARRLKAKIAGKPMLTKEEIEKKKKTAEKRIREIIEDFVVATGAKAVRVDSGNGGNVYLEVVDD